MKKSGKLVLIIGPSGVGKSVILKALRVRRHPEWHFPRSATTRKRREKEGDDLYRFVSDEEFDRLLAAGKILEWAVVHGGPRYGTLVNDIIPFIERGETVVREVDVQGFDAIRCHPLFSGDIAPYLLQSIFIAPESREQLIEHITKRAPIANEELARRIASMNREMEFASLCDVTVKNVEGKLEEAVERIERVIAGEIKL